MIASSVAIFIVSTRATFTTSTNTNTGKCRSFYKTAATTHLANTSIEGSDGLSGTVNERLGSLEEIHSRKELLEHIPSDSLPVRHDPLGLLLSVTAIGGLFKRSFVDPFEVFYLVCELGLILFCQLDDIRDH